MDIILNAMLIPGYASAGAAVGTLGAECAVLVVQYVALRDEVQESFQSVRYIKLLAALVLCSAASLWVKALGFGDFLTLSISAVLFFGIYGGILWITKEELVREMIIGR